MLEDSDRLLGTVEQVLKARRSASCQSQELARSRFCGGWRQHLELAEAAHNLKPEALRFGAEHRGLGVMGNPKNCAPRFNLWTMPSSIGEHKNIWWTFAPKHR